MEAASVTETEETPLDRELAELRSRFLGASILGAGGQNICVVPDYPVPPGWNRQATTVRFVIPAGYPHANPDCFFVDGDMRLANGALPQNAQMQALAGVGQLLWFSWHLKRGWKPGRDRLTTWLGSIADRLAQTH